MTERDAADIEWIKSVSRWMEAVNKNVSKIAAIAELHTTAAQQQNEHLSRIRTMVALTLGIVIGSAITQALLGAIR